MALDVVDLRDVGQELEMDEVLAGPDRGRLRAEASA